MDDTPHPKKGIRAGYAAGLIAADVDTPGNLSCSTGIIRPKASDEGGSLTPSSDFHTQVVEAKHNSRVSPSHGSVPAGYGDPSIPRSCALTGLRVQVPP